MRLLQGGSLAALAGSAVLTFGVALSSPAFAQEIAAEVTVSSERTFVSLQSYVVGEVNDSLVFLTGLADFGLHSFGENAFPGKKFSTQIHVVNRTTGSVASGSITHLTQAKRRALMVTAAAAVQYDDTLYIYGGYGPPVGLADFHTRGTVTAVNLAAVEQAILNSDPVPGSAIIVSAAPYAKVAGAGIVKMGDRFALICGADADGEYINQPDPEYANRVAIFDRTVSMTAPVEVLEDGLGFDSPMRRRDVNVLPVSLPALGGGGGSRPGFVVVCGVFESGIFPWENPLIWGEGDALPFMDQTFTQHMGAYEGPIASLYSESRDVNHVLNFAGISGYNWDSGTQQFTWNPSAPWTVEVSHMTMASGVFMDEVVVGEMPWPVTNAHLVLEDSLPKNSLGQVLIDQLPTETPVLLGRIYGGIAADYPDNSPPTSGSAEVLDVMITVAREPGQAATLIDYTLNHGVYVSGGLSDLQSSDNQYLRMRSHFGFTSLEPNLMRCTFAFTSPLVNPDWLDLMIESRIGQPNGISRVRVRNWSNNQLQQVHQYTLTTTDSTESIYDISAVERVRSTDSRVEVQVSNSAMVVFSSAGFETFIDFVGLEVR